MIQWYPGHMAKAIREIDEKIKLVDLVIVLLDARIPYSSFNPLLKEKIGNKMCLYILTKKDLADDIETKKWIDYYTKKSSKALAVNSKEPKQLKEVLKTISLMMEPINKKNIARGLKPRAVRTMVVGIPNVGKSTFINALVNKKVTNVGDKPGVTKVQQWIRISKEVELLDTPGVLWPKFASEKIGYNLAIIGSIKDDILKILDVAEYGISFIKNIDPQLIMDKYHLDHLEDSSLGIIYQIGHSLKYYLGSKTLDSEVDLNRVSTLILQDIRKLGFGKFTFDRCEEYGNE